MLSGFLFIMAGTNLIQEGKSAFGIIQLIAGLSNLAMLIRFKNLNLRDIIEFFVFAMNIVVAFFTARDYVQQDSNYIHFVWIFITIMYSFLLLRKIWSYRKEQKNTKAIGQRG